jgi:hypothetical protein
MRRLRILAALATLGAIGATQARAAEPPIRPIPQASPVAYVEEQVVEQALDASGNSTGPRQVVETRRLAPGEVSARREVRAAVRTTQAARRMQATGCRGVAVSRIGRGWIGEVLWKYTQEKGWCWATPRLTAVNVNAYPCCNDPLWSFQGHIGSQGWYLTWSGHPQGGHYSFRQGRFATATVWKFPSVSSTPWVKVWVWGNGDYGYQTGE